MKLDALLAPWALPVPAGIEISDLTLDSSAVARGSLFCAVAGGRHHGLDFAADAVEAGAVAVLYEPAEGVQPPTLPVPLLALPGLRDALPALGAHFYGEPAAALTLVGVTGTDGKSSVVHLLAQLLRACDIPTATLGTLGLDLGAGPRAGSHTTPDALRLQAELAAARDAGCQVLAMEVSSHALDQGRVAGLPFAHAALTTLGRDHLDYHASIADYYAAKRKLLAWPGLRSVHANGDAPLVRRAVAQAASDAGREVPVAWYGGSDDARWRSAEVRPSAEGLALSLQSPLEATLTLGLYGDFNAGNVLAAASLAEACGAAPQAIVDALPTLRTVPGRMDCLRAPGRPTVLVDYAHTPDALEAALSALRVHRPAALHCVFGCGGDRDRGKRPLMAAAAEKHADAIVLTDDNPRGEDPEQIFADTRAGFSGRRPVQEVHDRALAIRRAIAAAGPEDIVLIAGKGHEDYQLVGGQRRAFSDHAIARVAFDEAEA